MTNKDKEMLLDELEKLETFTIIRNDSGKDYECSAVAVDDVMYVVLNFIEAESVSLDYNAEYNRLLDRLAKSEDEKTSWKHTAEQLKNENNAMRNVIRTFEFILGRKLEL